MKKEKKLPVIRILVFLVVVLQLVFLAAFYPKYNNEKDVFVPTQSPDEASKDPQEYIPASLEDYVMKNFKKLGYDLDEKEKFWMSGCDLYKDPKLTTDEFHHNLLSYTKELPNYFEALRAFDGSKTEDILEKIRYGKNVDRSELCKTTRLHPDGLQGLFPSKQLSLTKSGHVEPLLPPFRNPKYCDYDYFNKNVALSYDFLVHDFEAICLNLKPTSRMVLIDMGAALDFHGSVESPIFELITSFEKFGMPFDHIYAFEIDDKDPKKVYEKDLPVKYLKSYHWINTGVKIILNIYLSKLKFLSNCFICLLCVDLLYVCLQVYLQIKTAK